MNGRRVLMVLLAMMLFSFGASAQKVKVSFGVTGGGIATMLSGNILYATSPMYMSGYGGAVATVNYGSNLGLRAGVNYAMQGSQHKLNDADLKASQSYLNVPVALMYHIKSFISVEAGFYQNILLSSSMKEKGFEEVVISPDEGALKYNFGVLAGLSFNFGRLIFANVRYNYGLSKAYVIDGVGHPASSITLGVGVNIISTKKSAF